jgi:hypothetical protein
MPVRSFSSWARSGWDHGRVTIPSDVRLYLKRLVERLSATLGDRLLGFYALGSVAFETTGRRVLTWMSTV